MGGRGGGGPSIRCWSDLLAGDTLSVEFSDMFEHLDDATEVLVLPSCPSPSVVVSPSSESVPTPLAPAPCWPPPARADDDERSVVDALFELPSGPIVKQ